MNKHPISARELIYGNIDAIMANAQRMQRRQSVDLSELLTDEFMRENSSLHSIGALFGLAGQTEVSQDTFDAIEDDHWTRLVRCHTRFSCWDEMFNTASQAFVRQSLLEGIG